MSAPRLDEGSEREVALIEKAALRVGMKSLMNHGAASCVYSEGCNGVSQEHLVAFARAIALHCAAALSTGRLGGEAEKELAQIYDAFGIGSAARSIHILRENLSNVLRRERCLAAIERTFFMVPTEPEEEDDGVWGEECLLNWGQDPDEYVRTFRKALKTLNATPAESVYLVATGDIHEGQMTYTRHDVRPPLCDAETLYTAPSLTPAAKPQGDSNE